MIKISKLILFVSLVLVLSDRLAFGHSTTDIERVQKNVLEGGGKLTSSDKDVIGGFVKTGLRELLLVEKESEMAGIRLDMVRFAGQTAPPEPPTEYSFAYIKAVKSEIEPVFKQVSGMPGSERKARLELNLMILLSSLKSSELSEFGLPLLSHANAAVKYWAVKTVADKSIAAQLNSEITGDAELQKKIVSGLMGILTDETPAVILDTITEFAGALKGSGGKELLKQVCMLRTKAYENWSVTYELMDAALLNAVAAQVNISDSKQLDREELVRMFAQLYSYVIQRYLLGEKVLDSISKLHLAGVMLDVEEKGLSKLMGSRQFEIKQALTQRKNLDLVHDSILGSTKSAGQLASKITFDYGKGPAGTGPTYPKTLKAPPKTESTELTESTESP